MSKISNYTALDFETANGSRASICAVGFVRVSEGRIVESRHQLIKPEGRFDYRNTLVHGITELDVRDAPNFADYWDELRKYLGDVVVAHNAAFDIGCLRSSLDFYGLAAADFKYLCTLRISRKILGLKRNTLDALADHFALGAFNHHNALSDAEICAKLFDILATRTDVIPFEKDFLEKKRPRVCACDIANLKDGERDISPNIRTPLNRRKFEIFDAANNAKFAENSETKCANCDPHKSDSNEAVSQFSQKIDTPQNSQSPRGLNQEIRDTKTPKSGKSAAAQARAQQTLFDFAIPVSAPALPPRAPHPQSGNNPLEESLVFDFSTIDFSKNFAVAGVFTSISRREVEGLILYRGGTVQNGVDETTDYVIIGDVPVPAFAKGEFGKIIDAALEFGRVSFVSETHFLNEVR